MLKKYFYKLLGTMPGHRLFIRVARSLFVLPEYQNSWLKDIYYRLLFQSMTNNQVIPYHIDRVWPYWVYRQFSPKSSGFSNAFFNIGMMNHTQRNWTALSVPGAEDIAIVDPRGLVTPYENGWSLDFWLASENKFISPANQRQVTQVSDDKIQAVRTSFKFNGVDIESEVFFQHDDVFDGLVYEQVKVINPSEEQKKISLFFAIRPYNPEGIVPIDEIVYLTSNAFVVDNRLGVVFDNKPDNVVCINFKDGDVSEHYKDWEFILKTQCKDHLASAFVEYRMVLRPGEQKVFSCKMLTQCEKRIKGFYSKALSQSQKNKLVDRVHLLVKQDYLSARLSVQELWKDTLENTMNIELPDEKMEALFKNNFRHILALVSDKGVYSGAFTYRFYSVTHSVQVILALLKMGAFDYAKRIIQELPFITKMPHVKYQDFDVSLAQRGQVLFVLKEYYMLTGDRDFVQSRISDVDRVAKQMMSLRKSNRNKSGILKGLYKNGLSFECSEGKKDSYMWDNMWGIAGLEAAMVLAGVAQKEDSCKKWNVAVLEWKNVFENYVGLLTQDSKYGSYIPVSPSRLLDSAMVSSLLVCYPLDLYSITESLVKNTLHVVDERFFSKGAIYDYIGHSGYSMTSNARMAQVLMKAGDKRALDIVFWLNEHAFSTGSWPELMHPITMGGCAGDGHFIAASAEYVILVRNMLVRAEGDILHLCPLIPEAWISPGSQPIMVYKCPTKFGLISFSVSVIDDQCVVEINHKYKVVPAEVKISLPKQISSVSYGVERRRVNNNYVLIPATVNKVELSVIYEPQFQMAY